MTTYRAQEKSVKAQIEYKADQILRNPKLRYAQRTTVKFNDFLYGK